MAHADVPATSLINTETYTYTDAVCIATGSDVVVYLWVCVDVVFQAAAATHSYHLHVWAM